MSEKEAKKLIDKEVKRRSRLKKLELNMQLLNRRIKELEEKELSINAMQDESDYTLCEKYKSRLIQVWKIHCKLSRQKAQLGRNSEQTFVYEGTKYMQINRTITHLINKYNYFPDYCDVVELVTKCNNKFDLNISKTKIQNLSQRVFEEVGKSLKARRIKDYKEEFGCHLTDSIEEDPADKDVELRKKLDNNKKVAHQRLNQVFSYYAEKEKESSGEEEEEDDDEEAEQVEEINEAGDNNYIVDEVIKNEDDKHNNNNNINNGSSNNNTDDDMENNTINGENNTSYSNNNNDDDNPNNNSDGFNNNSDNNNKNNGKNNDSSNMNDIAKDKKGMDMIVITDDENDEVTGLMNNIDEDSNNDKRSLNDAEDLCTKSENDETCVRIDAANVTKGGISDTEVDYRELRSPNVSFVSLGSLMEELKCNESDDEPPESSDGLVEGDSLDECSVMKQKEDKEEHAKDDLNGSTVEISKNQTKLSPSFKSLNKIHSDLIRNDLVDDDVKALRNVARVADNLIFLDSETILRPCYVSIHSLMFDLTNYVKEKLKNKCECKKIKGEKRKINVNDDIISHSNNTKRLKTFHTSNCSSNEEASKIQDPVTLLSIPNETLSSSIEQDNLSKDISDNKKAVPSTSLVDCVSEDPTFASNTINDQNICNNSNHSESIDNSFTEVIPSDSVNECTITSNENASKNFMDNKSPSFHETLDKKASPLTERVIGEIVCLTNSDEEDNKNKIAKLLTETSKISNELKNVDESTEVIHKDCQINSSSKQIISDLNEENENIGMEEIRQNDLVVVLDDEDSLSFPPDATTASTTNSVAFDPRNSTIYRRSINTSQRNIYNNEIEVDNGRCHKCFKNVCVCRASSEIASISQQSRIDNDKQMIPFKRVKRLSNQNIPGLNLTPKLRKEIKRVTNLIFKQNSSQINLKSRYQPLQSSSSQNQFSQQQNQMLRENFVKDSVEYGFNKKNPKIRRSLMMSEHYNSYKHGYRTNRNFRQRPSIDNRNGDENYGNYTAQTNFRNKFNNLNCNRIPYKSYSVIETHSRRTSVNTQGVEKNDLVFVNEHPKSINSNGLANNYAYTTMLRPVDDQIVSYNTKSDTIAYSYHSDNNNNASSSGIDSMNFLNMSTQNVPTFDTSGMHHVSSSGITLNQFKAQMSVNNRNTFAIGVANYKKKYISKVQAYNSFSSKKNTSSKNKDDCYIFDVEPDVPTSVEHSSKYEAISSSIGTDSAHFLQSSNHITILD